MNAFEPASQLLASANPSAVFRSQPSSDWKGPFPLPTSVSEYFSELGPVDVWIDGYGNPYFLPKLVDLWNFQAGYRYHPDTLEPFPDWNEDWLVIADEGGDPIIVSRSSNKILHAFHGEGKWEPAPMFESLVEMVTVFAILGDIVTREGRQLTDDDSIIRPEHRQEAQIRIGKAIGSPQRNNLIWEILGWR